MLKELVNDWFMPPSKTEIIKYSCAPINKNQSMYSYGSE